MFDVKHEQVYFVDGDSTIHIKCEGLYEIAF